MMMMRPWIVAVHVGLVMAMSGSVSAWTTAPANVVRLRPLYPTTTSLERPFSSSWSSSSSLQSKIHSDNDSEKSNPVVDPSSMVHVVESKTTRMENPLAMSAATALSGVWLTIPSAAYAAGPDWGIFEGRIGSLLHPITMGSLLLYSLYTAYLGFQWRRQRTMGDEIAALKQKLPAATASSSTSSDSVEQELGAVAAVVQETRQTSTLEAQIAALTRERKEIASKGPRDQHFSQGALLACIGTLFAIEVREQFLKCTTPTTTVFRWMYQWLDDGRSRLCAVAIIWNCVMLTLVF
jgi:hypothetical protein